MKKLPLLLILSLMLLLSLSCKKVQYGYWLATFTDDDGSIGTHQFYMNKRSNVLADGGLSLLFDEGQKTITSCGEFSRSSNSQGHYSSYSCSNFSGTISQRGGHGTYTYSKSVEYFPHTNVIIIGTGTFELTWQDKKEPKK